VRKRHGTQSRHSPAEYFLAAVGLAIVAFIVGLILTSGSCKVGLSPEIGTQPSAPRPTAT